MNNLIRKRDVVESSTPPSDTKVLWLDTAVGDLPQLKIFTKKGEWEPIVDNSGNNKTFVRVLNGTEEDPDFIEDRELVTPADLTDVLGISVNLPEVESQVVFYIIFSNSNTPSEILVYNIATGATEQYSINYRPGIYTVTVDRSSIVFNSHSNDTLILETGEFQDVGFPDTENVTSIIVYDYSSSTLFTKGTPSEVALNSDGFIAFMDDNFEGFDYVEFFIGYDDIYYIGGQYSSVYCCILVLGYKESTNTLKTLIYEAS